MASSALAQGWLLFRDHTAQSRVKARLASDAKVPLGLQGSRSWWKIVTMLAEMLSKNILAGKGEKAENL